MPKITFLPAGVTVEARSGETVFEVGRRAGIPVETSCVGQGTCGLCRVKIVAGEETLNAFNDTEVKHLGNVYYLTRVRLSCQTILGDADVTVELAPKRAPKRGASKWRKR